MKAAGDDDWGNRVSGRCPACGYTTLFVAMGGHITCSLDKCPNPTAVADRLLMSRKKHIVMIVADEVGITLACNCGGRHPLGTAPSIDEAYVAAQNHLRQMGVPA